MKHTGSQIPLRSEVLSRLQGALRRTPAQAAYLFGSWSRGTADAYSDVDLVVICETPRPFFERYRDFESLYELPYPVDLLVYRPEEVEQMVSRQNPFIEEISKSSKILSTAETAKPAEIWLFLCVLCDLCGEKTRTGFMMTYLLTRGGGAEMDAPGSEPPGLRASGSMGVWRCGSMGVGGPGVG